MALGRPVVRATRLSSWEVRYLTGALAQVGIGPVLPARFRTLRVPRLQTGQTRVSSSEVNLNSNPAGKPGDRPGDGIPSGKNIGWKPNGTWWGASQGAWGTGAEHSTCMIYIYICS